MYGNLPFSCAVANADGMVTFCSPKFCDSLGLAPSQVINHSILQLISENMVQDFTRFFSQRIRMSKEAPQLLKGPIEMRLVARMPISSRYQTLDIIVVYLFNDNLDLEHTEGFSSPVQL